MAYASTTRTVLRARLQDRYTGDPFWTTTDANDAINEAMRQFNLFTGYWRGSATVVTVADTPFLTVSATLTKATRVTRAGKVLARKSIVELYRQRPNWRTQHTASGSGVPTTISEWAPVGLGGFAIWPADHAGGTTLTVEAVKITPVLTADGNFIDIGDEELKVILDECLYILAFKRPSILEAMTPKHQAFLAACVERNDQLRGSSYFREILGRDAEQRLDPVRVERDPPPGHAVTPNQY